MSTKLPYLRRSGKTGVYSYRRRIPDRLRALFGGHLEYKVSLKAKDIEDAVLGWRRVNAEFDSIARLGDEANTVLSHEIVQKANTLLKAARVHPLQAPTLSAKSGPDTWQQFEESADGFKDRELEFLEKIAEDQLDDRQRDLDYVSGRYFETGYTTPYKALDPRSPQAVAIRIMSGEINVALNPTLTDLVEVYLTKNMKRKVRNPATEIKFERETRRIFKTMAADLPNGMDTEVDSIERGWVEDFLERAWVNASTRKKSQSRLVAAINTFNRENSAAPIKLNLEGLVTKAQADRDSKDRRSFTPEEFRLFVGNLSKIKDAETRLLGLVIAYTGTPNNEAAGLQWRDVQLGDSAPHMIIRDNRSRVMGKGRLSRTIPIVEPLLTEFRRYDEQPRISDQVFPRWNGGVNELSKPLNAAVVNLLPSHPNELVAYSARHTFRDRCSAVGMPEGVSSYLMGHQSKSSSQVHDNYGTGRPVKQLVDWMESIMACEEWGFYG